MALRNNFFLTPVIKEYLQGCKYFSFLGFGMTVCNIYDRKAVLGILRNLRKSFI